MSEEVDRARELKKKLIDSGYKAVEELIEVAKAPIIKKKNFDPTDELAAEKMKNAAAAKKTAIFDAYDILTKTQEQEKLMNAPEGEDPKEDKPKKNTDLNFAESRAK